VPEYSEAAVELGRLLASRGLEIVYGGASVGLMGALADAALAAGGTVIGVIPTRLVEHEIAHAGVSKLHVVETMHQRKALMAELADAVIALPGGTGTLDELFELFTWKQLGLHRMPLGLLDVPVPALACFAAGGLLYAPYPVLSATLFQRESPPELLSQVFAARGALTLLATPLGTALGGPLTAWLGAQHVLLVSAAATVASGLVATTILITHRRKQTQPEARSAALRGQA